MEFKNEDFARLQYNVKSLDPAGFVLNRWPELTRFPEFTAKITEKKRVEDSWVDAAVDIDQDKVIRYIFFCYDKNSPFLLEKNLVRRKVLCAIEAGFKPGDQGKFTYEVECLLKGQLEAANRMIVRFVRNQRDIRFALLVAGMENYYDNIQKLEERRRGDDAKDNTDKTELFTRTKKMLEELEVMADDIFNNDKELMYVADDINEEESGHITSYPEWKARQRQSKVEDQLG